MVRNKYKEKKKGVVRRFFGFMFYTQQFKGKDQLFTPMQRLLNGTQKLLLLDRFKQESEDFDESIRRLDLNEADLKKREKGFLINSFVLFLVGIFFGVVGVYLTMQGLIAAGLITQLFTFINFAFALYMHFWYFQVKNRKLGCTLKEWWENKVK